MPTVVGTRGQIVIERAIRDRLGIQPGWQALQVDVGDHIEVYFIPPEHEESLLGAARPFVRQWPAPETDWDEAVEEGSADDFVRQAPEPR